MKCTMKIETKLLTLTFITSSSMLKSNSGGMIPAPIPWILCLPKTLEASGLIRNTEAESEKQQQNRKI